MSENNQTAYVDCKLYIIYIKSYIFLHVQSGHDCVLCVLARRRVVKSCVRATARLSEGDVALTQMVYPDTIYMH